MTNMLGVDLNTYRFDYDLTFAALVMNADGTTYHRFGGRDETSASSRLTVAGLVRVLEAALPEHEAYEKGPKPKREGVAPRTVEQIPTMARRIANKKPDCVHCHTVNDVERELAQEEKRWKRDDLWVFPLPEHVGLKLDSDDVARVVSVTPGSQAAKAGAMAGDVLVTLGEQRILSEADVQWALERADAGPTKLPLVYERRSARVEAELELAAGWKRATALALSWRPAMWGIRPSPGFGGRDVSADEKEKLGVAFGFRVNYLVDWGEHAEDGKNAAAAGIRKGDVVVGCDSKRDFAGHAHFQAWFRLEKKAGEDTAIEVLREGNPVTVKMKVLP
ncbi:PDZ domain-containing protein [bacterium]|nr:PDZ domain-containing protein [bacterium]